MHRQRSLVLLAALLAAAIAAAPAFGSAIVDRRPRAGARELPQRRTENGARRFGSDQRPRAKWPAPGQVPDPYGEGGGGVCRFPHSGHPSGQGTKYRATVEGPSVTPDVMWTANDIGPFDAGVQSRMQAQERSWGDPKCRT